MKNLTWQNPEQLFVAQELINKVKSKCCGIKVAEQNLQIQKENTKKDKQIAEQNLQIAELNLIIAKMTTESENHNKNRSGIFSSKDMYPNESPTQTTDNYDGIMNMTKEQMEELINNKKQ